MHPAVFTQYLNEKKSFYMVFVTVQLGLGAKFTESIKLSLFNLTQIHSVHPTVLAQHLSFHLLLYNPKTKTWPGEEACIWVKLNKDQIWF